MNALPASGTRPRNNGLALASAGLVAACTTLGGGTHSGFLGDVILQLLSIPVLVWGAVSIGRSSRGVISSFGLAIAAAAVLLPIVQLVPLPHGLAFPGKAQTQAAEIRQLVLNGPDAATTSVALYPSILALLSALPPLAVFVSISALDRPSRRLSTLVVLMVGAASVFLGLLQVAQGPASVLRLFSITNPSEAVGFFANRNHFSAFLYVLMLLTAAWSIDAGNRFASAPAHRRSEARHALPLLATLVLVVIVVAAQTFARSRAGLGLAIAGLMCAGLLAATGQAKRDGVAPSSRLVLAAGLFGALLAVQFALFRILERFEADALSDARIPFARNTWEAAMSHLPLGAGLGSFVQVYGLFEHPVDTLLDTYANRAHNDFLELWLEVGIVAPALLACFIVWLLVAASRAWRTPDGGRIDVDVLLARASSVAVLLLLAHSFVDYPLRTTALLSMLALCCGLLMPDTSVARDEEPSSPDTTRVTPSRQPAQERGQAAQNVPRGLPNVRARADLSRLPVEWAGHRTMKPEPSPAAKAAPSSGPTSPGERWGAAIDWPAEWKHIDIKEPDKAD
ncbi:MAG: O-antigen ligase family protein [Hyphomicrobiaceae bacterium]